MDELISILLIEDDTVDQMAMRRAFGRENLPYALEVASSIAEARERLSKRSYDLVITDHTLGDGTGFDAFELVKDRPVIFATGSGTESIAARALQLGARDYLIKDPDGAYLKLLSHRINMVLGQWRAERALLESEERYRDLFENSTELIQSVAPDGKILFANRAWLETLGYTGAELSGLSIAQIIAPDHLDHCSGIMQRLMAGEEVGVVEVAFLSKHGRRVELEGSISVRSKDGVPVATRGIFRDVTLLRSAEKAERLRAHHTLRCQASLLRLRDQETADLQVKIRLATEECAAVLGVSRASMWLFDDARENIVCTDLFLAGAGRHESGARLTARQFPTYFKAISNHAAVAAQDAHSHPATSEFSRVYLAPLGITSLLDVPVRVGGTLAGVLCCEHTGTPRKWTHEDEEFATGVASFLMLSLEAEERRRAEALSRESEERFRYLFENSPDAIFVDDLEGVVLDANPAACLLHGLAREQLVGRHVMDLVPPDEREAVRKGYPALVAGEIAKIEGFSWTADGCAVPVEITSKRIVFSGRPALLLNARDITERRKAEAALRQAHDELEQRVQERTAQLADANKQLQLEMAQRERLQMKMLLAIELEQERIGQDLHDGICQVLTGAKFRTAMLGRKIRDAAEISPDDSDSIEALIKDAIKQARGVAYGLNPVRSEEGGLMKALEELIKGANAEAGPACVFHCPEPVLFDDHSFTSHLYRIAQEALQNALKHAHARNITIELGERADVVTLAVSDDGVGFSLPQSKAAGMGLSNLRRRASMMGGKIEINPSERGGTMVVCRVRRGGTKTESGT